MNEVVGAILAGKISAAIKGDPLLVAVQRLLATPKGIQLAIAEDLLILKIMPMQLSNKASKLLKVAKMPRHGIKGKETFDLEAAGFQRLEVSNASAPVYGCEVGADILCMMIDDYIDVLVAKGAKTLPTFDSEDVWSVLTGAGVNIDEVTVYLSGESAAMRVSKESPIGVPHLSQQALPTKIGNDFGYLLKAKGKQQVFLAIGAAGIVKQDVLVEQVAADGLSVIMAPLVNISEGLGLEFAKAANTDTIVVTPAILPVISTASEVAIDVTASSELSKLATATLPVT